LAQSKTVLERIVSGISIKKKRKINAKPAVEPTPSP
jgi:hypothetical protein